MARVPQIAAALVAASALFASNGSGASSVGLANPAAEHCVSERGFYGIRDEGAGKRGVCVLADGSEVDAWTQFRRSIEDTEQMESSKIANPAARYCVANGGTYNLETSQCSLPVGTEINAWEFLRQAHEASISLANPAATYCIEVGGAYEIRDGESGKFGICRLPDGTEVEAWALFRKKN